ncbi:MAG: DUF3179 domain-containing protein, partial [Candidatus Dadabacteria bacterium]
MKILGRKISLILVRVFLITLLFSSYSMAESLNLKSLGFYKTNLSKHTVSFNEFLSGGPPKDGIPALLSPKFETVNSAKQWLSSAEPVILLKVKNDAKAYPLQILIWHEIVNDTVGNLPVAVTFCPLCYSAITYMRLVKGKEIHLGVSGLLRNSDMVM